MKTTTFITFVGDNCGKAEEAIHFYTSIFPNSKIESIVKYTKGEVGGNPELIKYGSFKLNNVEFRISENDYNHAWSITPGISIFVDCESENEVETIFEKLSTNGGKIMIPLDNYESDNYGFGKKFGWCEDKYGISWQLNLL